MIIKLMAIQCATDAPKYYGLLGNSAHLASRKKRISLSGHQHRCAHVFHVSHYFVLTYEPISWGNL